MTLMSLKKPDSGRYTSCWKGLFRSDRKEFEDTELVLF